MHESVADGSIWFGHDSRHTNPDGTVAYDFNTDETVKFPSAVALLWRWTGDDRFRDEMYDFTVRNLRYVVAQPGRRRRRLARGARQRRAHAGWARRSWTTPSTSSAASTTWPTWPVPSTTGQPTPGRRNLARQLQQRFDGTWWFEAAQQYADSLNEPGNQQSFQKHWIGQTPMDAELRVNGQTVPGLAPFDHGDTALAGRENNCYSGEHPLNPGLFHTGCGGGPERAGRAGHLRPDDLDPVDR